MSQDKLAGSNKRNQETTFQQTQLNLHVIAHGWNKVEQEKQKMVH